MTTKRQQKRLGKGWREIVEKKKPIAADKVDPAKEPERFNLCFLYNNVERKLSLALQPGMGYREILQLVQEGRDKLRIAMRKMGWQGPF